MKKKSIILEKEYNKLNSEYNKLILNKGDIKLINILSDKIYKIYAEYVQALKEENK